METKVKVTTSEDQGQAVHSHVIDLPDGVIPAGTYRTDEVDGSVHEIILEEDLQPGESVEIVTSASGVGPHVHRATIEAIPAQPEESEEAEEQSVHRPEDQKGKKLVIETKSTGGRIIEVKQSVRNGVEVGIVAGYIATWDADAGGIFGVPDQFHRGAFLNSLRDHRERGNRPIRLKDHHGRTIGGFPIETVKEDEIGLFAVGEINLETQFGREAHSLARQGVLTDFSAGFSAVDDKIQGGVRDIFEAIVWEGSIVDEPMNQNAVITEVKSAERDQQFLGVDEAKNLTTRQLESALRESGVFSKGASRLLASRLAPVTKARETRYDTDRLSSILRDLQDSKRLLGQG